MNKLSKLLLTAVALIVVLSACSSNTVVQPIDGYTALDTHSDIVSEYDSIKSGHSIFEYSGEDFKEIIELDQRLLVYIGRPS